MCQSRPWSLTLWSDRKWLDKNYSLYSAHTVSPVNRVPSWNWPLTKWPKINRTPPLIINNLCVEFESDCTKLVCIVPKSFHRQSTEVDLDIETQNQKKGDPPLIVHILSMRFQTSAQIVLCSMSTRFKRFVRQRRPWSLTLWPKIHRVPPLIINSIYVKNKTNHPISINKHPSVTAYKAIHFSGGGATKPTEHRII